MVKKVVAKRPAAKRAKRSSPQTETPPSELKRGRRRTGDGMVEVELAPLVWTEVTHREWHAPDPSGEDYDGRVRLGSVIKLFTNGPHKRWFAYRDCQFLGSMEYFEEAKQACEHYVFSVGQQEHREQLRKTEAERSVGGNQFAGKPALKDEGSPVDRSHIKKSAAPPRTAPSAQPLAGGNIIEVINKGNPRKEGTTPYERYEKLKEFDGKSVAEFLAGGGFDKALENAVKQGHARLRR